MKDFFPFPDKLLFKKKVDNRSETKRYRHRQIPKFRSRNATIFPFFRPFTSPIAIKKNSCYENTFCSIVNNIKPFLQSLVALKYVLNV